MSDDSNIIIYDDTGDTPIDDNIDGNIDEVEGGKKINIIGVNNIQLTSLEFENLLENTTINGEYLYSQEDIKIFVKIYNDIISKLLSTKKGEEYDKFLMNELLFQYYIPIRITNYIEGNKENKTSQKYINIQKNINKKRNIGIIKHVEETIQEKKIFTGQLIQINYPINVIFIVTNNNNKIIIRYDANSMITYNGIIMPSHNVSIRSSLLESHYKKYPIKDIFLSGYYSYNIPFRREYSQFITSHTYKLSDDRSILPILYPYYGKSNKSRILLYNDFYNEVNKLIKYNKNIIAYAENSTSCIYNNLVYRYFPEKLETLLGKGVIKTPDLILNFNKLEDEGFDIKFKEILGNKFKIMIKLDKFFLLDELGELKYLYYYGIEDSDIKTFKNNLESNIKILTQNDYLNKVMLNKILYRQSAIYTIGKNPDLVKLNDSEKKIVENEVKKRILLQNQEVNKCGHVELVNKINDSSKYRTIEYAFNKLINYLIIPKILLNPELDQTIKIETLGKNSIDILQCSSCKFDVICPHLYHKFVLELKYISPTSKINVLTDIKNFLIRNYVDASATDFSYYCRICGGKIAEDTSVMDIMPDVNLAGEFIAFNEDETDEVISKIIYSFTSTIIKNNISFKTIIDPKLVINAVMKMIKHEIKHIYSLKVAKSGSNFSDYSLYPYVLINVVIAILLIITNRKENDIIFTENKNKIVMDLMKGGGGSPINIKMFQENFNIATRIIMQNKLLFDKNEIPIDHIRQLITIAYKRLSLEGVEPPVLSSDIKFSNLINIYPLYDYLYNHARLYGKNIARDNVDEIVKLTRTQILSGNYKNKTFSIELVKKFPSQIKDDKILNFKQKVIENLFGEFIDLDIFLQEYSHINRVEFYEKHKKLLDEEKLLYGNWKEKHFRSILPTSGLLLSRFSYNKSEVRLGVAYDENGNKRKWNEFVYSSGVKKIGSIPDGMKPLSIKDKKSGNNYLSKISVNSNNKIREGLEFNDLISNFYMFYQFRCPIGSIHQFSKNSCKKCGVSSEDLKNKNLGYFNKYKNAYLSRRAASKAMRSDFKISQSSEVKKVNKFTEEIYNNITFVNQVAKVFGQSENVLLNLGLMEKIDIKDLTQIKVNPYNEKIGDDTIYYIMNQSKDEVRINKIKQYINNLLIYYELVLAFNIDLMIPAQAEIMKKYTKFISIKGNSLRKVLPNIHDKWNKFIGTEQYYPNKLYGNKLLKFLYASLIELTEVKGDKDVVGIAKDFAHWFMKFMINIEVMTSMYNIDQLRRDRTESYNKVRDELDKDKDLVQNEVLEVIQLYDPELASTDKHDIENNLADSSFEMTIDVDENNGPDAGDD